MHLINPLTDQPHPLQVCLTEMLGALQEGRDSLESMAAAVPACPDTFATQCRQAWTLANGSYYACQELLLLATPAVNQQDVVDAHLRCCELMELASALHARFSALPVARPMYQVLTQLAGELGVPLYPAGPAMGQLSSSSC